MKALAKGTPIELKAIDTGGGKHWIENNGKKIARLTIKEETKIVYKYELTIIKSDSQQGSMRDFEDEPQAVESALEHIRGELNGTNVWT